MYALKVASVMKFKPFNNINSSCLCTSSVLGKYNNRIFNENEVRKYKSLTENNSTRQILNSTYLLQSFKSNSLPHKSRGISTSALDKSQSKNKPDWSRAVSEAEKVVGYPTSFLSLRWLLSDEIANVALHLRKLVGSNHPLLKTAKSLLYNGKSTTMQTWGLIVLLVSKAAGQVEKFDDMEQDKAAGVLHSQRALAEVTEMIRTSHLVHQGLVNLKTEGDKFYNNVNSNEITADDKTNGENLNDMTFGNKIALLSGDYLLGNSCVELANLRNQEIVELISSALRDLSESEFIGIRDQQNIPLPFRPKSQLSSKFSANKLKLNYSDKDSEANITEIFETFENEKNTCSDEEDNLKSITLENAFDNPASEWELRHILSAGSLLGKSCQGALKLAGHPPEMQRHAYLFGRHLALAWQACIDLEPFQSTKWPSTQRFSLVSAPILFHLCLHPELYDREITKGLDNVENIDYQQIREEVARCGVGVALTRHLQKRHADRAKRVLLELLPKNDATCALNNILGAMEDL
ncbi:decaprenyl-diphosphate synthase subunit 2-like [Ctenocephalides felis]|uniref:decaprenyl-diphosphate synthase subunit 2-like n=1 Tax=Ctenocephalides felis TaxID=7515 RepID=UPI000E6E2602|nr:decaprenyl-diphosphate synthase subunit 2-like [Ctenocephalides felis]